MADLTANSRSKKKKRKQPTTLEENPNSQKKHRGSNEQQQQDIEFDHTVEAEHPWRNLLLILSLQNKELNLPKKVELAFNYVNSRTVEKKNDYEEEEEEEDYETVKLERLVVFLNDWVQSLLISTEKKITIDTGVIIEACLDCRCWVIFKFCLEQSLKLHVTLSLSRNLLRAFSRISRSALSLLMDATLDCKDSVFDGEGSGLYRVVLDCVSLVFLSHGGLPNQNLELWISTLRIVLEFVLKSFDENLEDRNAGFYALQFCCLMLEPFGKFLKVHPVRKNGFRDFVDELLGPLLNLLGVLHCRFDGSNSFWMRNLLPIVKEVLSQGLFHSVHLDGFMNLHSIDKYSETDEGKVKDSKTVNKSYHRHFFDKLEWIMASKKEAELSGLGELFQLFVDGVKKQKVASLLSEENKMADKHDGSMHLLAHGSITLYQSISAPPEKNYGSGNLDSEKRKSLFNFFVQIIDPLFVETKSYLHDRLEAGPLLSDTYCTLKSINHLLIILYREKLYVKTEDISEGAFLNFLKKIYGIIFSFSANLVSLPINDIDSRTQETLTSLAKELLVSLSYLLDIEYEVIENDLVSLWLMVLSYLALGHSLKGASSQCLLIPQILEFGCQLVKLYCELRQVESTIFALCKATRHIIVHESNGRSELNYDRFGSCTTSLPYESFAKSVEKLLCSRELKLAIHNGIKAIPEGQASEFIRQLNMDLSESIEWMRSSSSLADAKELQESNTRSCRMRCIDLQTEVFGRGFSEIYALALDSLTVTSGNSNLLGKSLNDLMAVIRPFMSVLVGLQPDSVNQFLSFVTGKTSDVRSDDTKYDVLNFGESTHWIFVFFFRLYMSCRSLYRQVIALMHPETSRKMSVAMWDLFTAYSGRDSMERTNWTSDNYFSWILQPSASLLVVIKSVSESLLKGCNADISALIYVLHAMALQRLVDLNRQVKALEYMQKSIEGVIQIKLPENDGLSQYCKRSRKWGKHLSGLKKEADDLAKYILGHLSLLGDDSVSVCNTDDATCPTNCGQALGESNEWDLGLVSVNKKSLPTAIWWVVCQNIDTWSIHASKKKLKTFLYHLIRTSLPFVTGGFTVRENNHADEAGFLNKITVHQISSELITNSILYEHNFVCRHLASRFCRLLKNSVLSLFGQFSTMDVDFNSLPSWQEVLSAVGSSPMAVSWSKLVTFNDLSGRKPISHLSPSLDTDNSMESTSIKFGACQSLLGLLCWLPKGCMNSRSFSLYVTYLLNLERYIISSLSESPKGLSCYSRRELLRLLISCRRAMKYIVMAFCEAKTITTHSFVIPVLSEDSFFALWLLKSVSMVVGLQETFSKDHSDEIREMIFSLMDQTSYVLLALSKHDSTYAIHSLISKSPHAEKIKPKTAQELDNSNQSDSLLDSLENDKAWKNVLLMAESLKEQTQGLLNSIKDALLNVKAENIFELLNLNKLSSMLSCISGFLWGLASSLNCTNAIDRDKVELLRSHFGPSSQIGLCINVFADYICFILHMFMKDDCQPESSFGVKNVQPSDQSGRLVSREFLNKWPPQTDAPGRSQSPISKKCSIASTSDDCFYNASEQSFSLKLEEVTVACTLSKLNMGECQSLNKCALQHLLNGDKPDAAILVRQLLIASSALLRLNLQVNCTSSLSSLVPSFIGICQVLLLKLADVSEVPRPFSLVWLDGVLKYLQELGGHFPSQFDFTSNKNVYASLIELHLNALGKCITLQGKEATLASHDTESFSKILCSDEGLSEPSLSHMSLLLDEFKSRLRMSCKVLISKSTELNMLPAMQAIERALEGAEKGCTAIYKINTGSTNGGNICSTVAAAVDCFDLVLEYISGGQQSIAVRENIQKLVAALFSIIIHAQSPLVFYGRPTGGIHNGTDPGAVVLMCVEVLTRVSGKRALQMTSCHVAQSLHVPAVLFQDFCLLRLSKGRLLSGMFLDILDCNPVAGIQSGVVDNNFSVELFAACCRLLYTTVKHQKRESQKCIAVLQDSASVLLRCLEMVDNESRARKGFFSWGVQEGVKCASAFRRIYEELRQHKEDFGQHCSKFLSDYIWIYSGYGPLKSGIRREIDAALKPGVYALIDACSIDDLQYLHSVFGEGPCRNTLAVLQHDYKLNFQYEGKV